MARAFILVLDSFGIGGAPDAAQFSDRGANTLAALVKHRNTENRHLSTPHLNQKGLMHSAKMADGLEIDGIAYHNTPNGLYGAANEISLGKDTPSGHWEIAGQPVLFEWGYFPKAIPAFPQGLTDKICAHFNFNAILGNCHASGTDIIDKYGLEHIQTGNPICYTSIDSVFQIAAHETIFGLQKLYDLCEFVRKELDDFNIGRVIARPFIGQTQENFQRTGHRRDYSVLPPKPTILDNAKAAGREVIGIGKISDIYAHQGITSMRKATGNNALFDETLNAIDNAPDGALIMTNFVDFDMLYGHRRDTEGYASALEAFDLRLPELEAKLRPDDLVIITADHGCDPTWHGNDHTRERVPILAFGPRVQSRNIGIRDNFSDISASVAEHLSIKPTKHGVSFL